MDAVLSKVTSHTVTGVEAPPQPPIHVIPLSEVYNRLGSSPSGLSKQEAAKRLLSAGPNVIRKIHGKPLILKLLADFTHIMAILLWVGGAVAFAAGMPQLGYAIWLVNLINGLFSFWQEFKAEKATEALQSLMPLYARVLRDGEENHIPAADLVPGDVMLLAEGDHISADARLVLDAELRVDQSTLSGESKAVVKVCEPVSDADLAYTELPNLVFAGTTVAAGTGKAVVFATAMHTEFGKIAHLTQTLGEELSPLQKEIAVMTKTVSVVAVGAGMLFFVVALLMGAMTLAEGFIFALGMIVAFVPEGLLPTVTLALAMGVQRIAKRNAIVKRLSAVETLGSTTVICTDKTGTLTENEMTVRALWVARRQIQVSGAGYVPDGDLQEKGRILNAASDPLVANLLLAASLCSDTHLLPPNESEPRWTILGDPTEAALLVAAAKAGLNVQIVTEEVPRLREAPFDSHRKRMSTLNQVADRQWVYVKGAPKELLALCQTIALEKSELPLTEEMRAEIIAANDEYANNGLRVLAVASKPWPEPVSCFTADTAECDLLFLGLIAMMDPPRPEVSDAVQRCHGAGIRIIMITGDYGLTAATIARRIGIVHSPLARIITGIELDQMSEEELQRALPGEVIFARVSPEHKLRVVSALQAAHHIVAVTGDGVNDAPALKKADIGIAMGMTGTDVAKEAAAMILTDDNFASIVNAVEEGRAVYANIKRFTTYCFTSNAPEAIPFIFFALSAGAIPLALTIMQVLAIDLGTDLLPALALGVEPPEAGTMVKSPRRRDEHVVNARLLRRAYIWLGLAAGILAMVAFYLQYWLHGYWGVWANLPDQGWIYQSATAMALAAVVMTQIGNLFAQRTEQSSIVTVGFFGNPMIWWGIATEVVLLVLIIYLPFFQRIFGTAAFDMQNWLLLIIFIPALLIIDEARKWLLRRKLIR